MRPEAIILAIWLAASGAVALGTVPGSWLLDTTSPPSSEAGWIRDAWLPFGTFVDIDGIRFKLCADGDPPYGIYLYEEGRIIARGLELKGKNVEVYIKDYWFAGRNPPIGGMYNADIKVYRSTLNLTRPLFVVRPSLEVVAPGQIELVTKTCKVDWAGGFLPRSMVNIVGRVLENWTPQLVDIYLIWDDNSGTYETFWLDSTVDAFATRTSKGNKFRAPWERVGYSAATATLEIRTMERTYTVSLEFVNVKGPSMIENLATTMVRTFDRIENQTSEAIKDLGDTFYNQFKTSEERYREWIENLANTTEGALKQVENRLIEFVNQQDQATKIVLERLMTPNIVVYSPSTFTAGLTNLSYIETQNATITGIKLKDESGVLFSGIASEAPCTPNEGSFVDLEISYYGIYTGENKTWTARTPTVFEQGYFLDAVGKPLTLSESILVGWSAMHLILVMGLVALGAVGIITYLRRKGRIK